MSRVYIPASIVAKLSDTTLSLPSLSSSVRALFDRARLTEPQSLAIFKALSELQCDFRLLLNRINKELQLSLRPNSMDATHLRVWLYHRGYRARGIPSELVEMATKFYHSMPHSDAVENLADVENPDTKRRVGEQLAYVILLHCPEYVKRANARALWATNNAEAKQKVVELLRPVDSSLEHDPSTKFGFTSSRGVFFVRSSRFKPATGTIHKSKNEYMSYRLDREPETVYVLFRNPREGMDDERDRFAKRPYGLIPPGEANRLLRENGSHARVEDKVAYLRTSTSLGGSSSPDKIVETVNWMTPKELVAAYLALPSK